MRKYAHAFVVGLQSNLVYRWNFGVRSIFWFFHLLVVYLLWGAAYQGNPAIGGYSFEQTLTYFVAIFVLQFFVGAFNEDYLIGEDIRNGLINQFLLKPINYFAYRISVFGAARVVSGVFGLLSLAVAIPLIRSHLEVPHDAWRVAVVVPALALTAVIQFSIAYCFGMLAFWFLEIQGFVLLSMAVEMLLGGQIVPLDLLPAGAFTAARFLPFFYQAYFPAAVLTGRIGLPLALQGLAIQAFWALALVGLAHLAWVRGLRRHTAAGG
ncbi:MAG TPA: ABC-2 family transporter protein [Opitutaceae bacterium]